MSTTKKPNTTNTNPDTTKKLAELAERARVLSHETEQLAQALLLEQQLRTAKGTRRDLAGKAHAAVAAALPKPSVADSPLYEQIRQMVTAKPYTLRDLIAETKAEENKVKVVLLRMQRDEIGLTNLGSQYRALWFIPDAKLLERLKR